jgi:F-type H+-transporting ATPase subunit epsilon
MLVDTAEHPEDIDRVRAEAALERAKEQLRQKQSIEEYHVSQASLARAMLRLKEAGKIKIE